jgi:hypothetical protein
VGREQVEIEGMMQKDAQFWKEFGLRQKASHVEENRFVNALEAHGTVVEAEKHAGLDPGVGKKMMSRYSVGRKLLKKLEKTRVTAQVVHELSQRVIVNSMLAGAQAGATNEDKRTALTAAKLAQEKLKDFDGKTPEERALEHDEGRDRVALAMAFLRKSDGDKPN